MKVLIVEDKVAGRSVLRSVLSHLGAEIIEAATGLDALVHLEKDDPDVLVIDLTMPVLDGIRVLSMVRSSNTYANLPVALVASAVSEAEVRRLASLGVGDILVKPLKPEVAHERLKKLLVNAVGWRQQKAHGSGGSRERLLLVERDPNFRAFARPLLQSEYDVVELQSGAEAVSMFRANEWRPNIVCVGEGLQLVNEPQLLELLRDSAAELDIVPPRVFLLTTNAEAAEHKRTRWDGVIKKSFVPQLFREALQKSLGGASDPGQRLESILRDEMREEVRSATQQTLGVMTGQDLISLDAASIAEVPTEVLATVRLAGPSMGLAVDVQLVSSRAAVEQLGARVLRRPVTFEAGGSEVFGELVNTIAARVRASLGPRGYVLKLETPTVEEAVAGFARPDWLAHIGGETTAGERLLVGLSVARISREESAAEAGGGEGSETASTEPAVDDVLF